MTARVAAFVYRLALRAFPRGYRADYAAEMIDVFERGLAARPTRPLRFTAAACVDAVGAGRRLPREVRELGRDLAEQPYLAQDGPQALVDDGAQRPPSVLVHMLKMLG